MQPDINLRILSYLLNTINLNYVELILYSKLDNKCLTGSLLLNRYNK